MAVWSSVDRASLSPDFRLDAEYYRPDVLALRRAVEESPFEVLTIEDLSDSVVNFGAYSLCNEIVFQEPGERDPDAVPFVTAQDIQDGIIDFPNARWISAKQHRGLLWKSQVKRGQVLVAMAARLGHAAVYDRQDPLNSSQDIAKITITDPEKLDPYYLAAFINSALGRGLLLASQTGSVQQHTNLGRIKSLPVVVLPPAFQLQAAELYRRSNKLRLAAADTMTAAEALLLNALGLNHLDLSPDRTYARSFKDLLTAHRFGAEYHMPCKQRALDALSKTPHKLLSHHAPSARNLWKPADGGRGTVVRNFDLSDALDPFLDDSKEPVPAVDIGSSKKKLRAGDVVISRLRSYLKEIAIVRTGKGVPCVGSSEFIVLRPTGKGLSAETIFVYLRCSLVQTILKWSQDGSNHPRFSEDDLVRLPVPDRLAQVSPEIDRHVHDSITARQEAARLLDEARTMIERTVLRKMGKQ